MRGKNYNDGKRRVLTGGGYAGAIIAVLAVAIALVFLLLVYLPLTNPEQEQTEISVNIVSIEYPDKEIGLGSDISKVGLTVTYDDGTTEVVSMSNMISEGLDVSVSGTQNVALSYGGFEQTISIEVKDVDCQLKYLASVGGSIQGEANQLIVSGQDGDTVIAVPETGYVFSEWSDGYPYATRKDLAVNESREIMANFEKAVFRVTFFAYDGTVAGSCDVVYGEKATGIPQMTDPAMSVYGMTFQGWSVSEEDYSCVIRSMSIYPQYIKTATDVEVEVSTDQYGNVMGETDANECGYYAYDEKATIIASPYNSREFNKWEIWGYENKNDEECQWISLDKIGEIGAAETTIYIGDNREPCLFSSNASGNEGTKFALTFTPNQYMDDLKIRACFVYSKSTVTFINYQNSVKNNQECVVSDIPYGTTIGESLQKMSRTEEGAKLTLDRTKVLLPDDVVGMTFVGWYDKADIEQEIIDNDKIFGEPTTLIAKWSKIEYTIVFDYSTSDLQEEYSINVLFQNTIGSGGGIPTVKPTLAKNVFVGWEDELTKELVDDTTQIIAKEEYIGNAYFEQYEIHMVPRWKSVEHTLKVQTTGSGTVALEITSDLGYTSTTTVAGSYTLYEIYTYKIYFRADEGNCVSAYTWKHGSTVDVYGDAELASSSVAPVVIETVDNTFNVTFSPIRYTATIQNGNATYSGYITDKNTEAFYGEQTICLTFDHNTTLNLAVRSPAVAYEIKSVLLTGVVKGVRYTQEFFGGNLEGKGIQDYSLLLERCTSDLDIIITYSDVSYTMSVAQPTNGTIKSTTLNGDASEMTTAKTEEECSPGNRLFYAMEADEGSYISGVRINGVLYNVFDSTDGVVFYDWEINGVSYGITIQYIDGEYYYSYGSAVYQGVEYLYCKEVESGTETVFVVLSADGDYEEYAVEAQNAAPSQRAVEEVALFLREALRVDEKGIGDNAVAKDNRVTSVKVMILPEKDMNIHISTKEIRYIVQIEEDESIKSSSIAVNGSSQAISAEVSRGQNVKLMVTPVSGTQCIGYYVNGQYEAISSVGSTFMKELVSVQEDVTVRFVFQKDTFSVTFRASEGNTVFVQEDKEYTLDKSYDFTALYGSNHFYQIRTAEGKIIKELQIDGVSQSLVYNMTSYTLTLSSVKKNTDIFVEVGNQNANTVPQNYSYNIGTPEKYYVSVQYGLDSDSITVLAESGYKIGNITLTGEIGGNTERIVIDERTAYSNGIQANDDNIQQKRTITVPNTVFTGEVEVYVATTVQYYTIECTDNGNGSVLYNNVKQSTVPFGTSISVAVTADENYYLDSLYVNETLISFTDENWQNGSLVYDTFIKEYTAGIYQITVCGTVDVRAVFYRYSYTVSVDDGSVNGTTEISLSDESIKNMTGYNLVNSSDGVAVPYGASVYIVMTADIGYHISQVYINGELSQYEAQDVGTVNNNTVDTFLYEGITQNIVVKVVYEINRYSFTYEIVNDSANFQGIAGAGAISCLYTKNGTDKYGSEKDGIAHGDNFYINISPAVSSGYYLYSMAITYKGYGKDSSATVTRTYDDGTGIISKTGGQVYFNRFWFANSDETPTGVTSDIEKITLTFKRQTYALTLFQTGEGGSMAVAFSNASALSSDSYIVLFGRQRDTENALTEFYYHPIEKKIYTKDIEGYVLTTISLREKTVTASSEEREWIFTDDDEIEYDMYLEYGLRCSVTTKPEDGYDRDSFLINGENRQAYISNNAYDFTFYRSTTVNVVYVIKYYDVKIESVVYNKGVKVSTTGGKADEFVNVTMIVEDSKGKSEYHTNGTKSLSIQKSLAYGTKVTFVMESYFDEKGVYLYNVTKTTKKNDSSSTTQVSYGTQSGYYGNVEGEVYYGPIDISESITVGAYFQVKQYSVESEIVYADDVLGETVNSIHNDSTSAEKWNVYWGDETVAGLVLADGYEVERIEIVEGTDSVFMTPAEPSVEQDYFLEDNKIIATSVQTDLIVRAYLVRKSYHLMYSISNTNYIANIRTEFNENNNKYAKQKVDSSTSYSPWSVDVRAYDELSVTLQPEDGYEIVAQKIDIFYVTQDANTYEWQKTDVTKTFVLKGTGVRDVKYFTFHEANKEAVMQVECDMILEISVTIKQYQIVTDISRSDADGDTSDTKNNTAVTMSILDKENGNYLVVQEKSQTPYTFKDGEVSAEVTTQKAQHFGVVQYEFTTPDGYRLSNFTVNGYAKEWLEEKNLLVDYSVSKTMITSENIISATYTYTISVFIDSTLLADIGYSELEVAIDLEPIVYQIVIVLNDSQKSFVTKNGRNGATDNKQITVYSAKEVTHFSTLIIEPSLEEGYEITKKNGVAQTSASIGTETGDSNLATGFANINEALTTRSQLSFTTNNLWNCDIGEDRTCIYFYYTTNIIRYQISLESNVYYAKDGSLTGPVSLAAYNTQKTETTKAGSVISSVVSEEDKTIGLADTTSGSFDESLPYFTKIKLTFSANKLNADKLFGVFAVYEHIEDEWKEIQDGNRGLTYTYDDYSGVYTLSFSVDSLGDRSFKIDYKEKTNIHVIVTNPYKYINGENLYYTDIEVYESDSANKVGKAVATSNVLNTGEVITEYVYTVNIGNYLRVKFIDKYADSNAKSDVEFYIGKQLTSIFGTDDVTHDLKDVVQYMVGDSVNNGTDNKFNTGKFTSNYGQNSVKGYQKTLNYDTTSAGYQVSGDEYIYVYDKSNYSYVQAAKKTEDATNSICDVNKKARTSEGGTLLFNTNKEETDELSYYTSNTAACSILTITCKAKENYAFYRLGFRQMDEDASIKQCQIVYDLGETSGWKYLTFSQAGDADAVRDFNDKNKNSYAIVDFSKQTNKDNEELYVFVIWVNGAIDVQAEFYRVYDVSYAVWRTDIYAGSGTVDHSASTVTVTDNGDTLYSTPFASSTEIGKATLSYGAEFTLEVQNDAILSNYVFVGWYANDINLISTLEKGVPEKNRYKQKFVLQAQQLEGLMIDGEEATEVVIYARFEPVIDVQVLNEKFYSFEDHFNSWEMGTVYVGYYGYDDGIIDADSTLLSIVEENESGRKISEVLSDVEDSKAFRYGKEWSDIYMDSYYGKDTAGSADNNYRIYSAWEEFSILHENITNSDYLTNSWTTTKLELLLDNIPTDVRFVGWQYYNWKEKEWQEIGYTYKDATYGDDYIIDCTKESYAFSLNYLYSYYTSDNRKVANMPYAISETNEYNLCENENDVSGKRPLLIRANTYKEVTVKLLQYAYSETYQKGLDGIDQSELSEDIVRPIIASYESQNSEKDRNYTDPSGVSGTYEYGTLLEIKYDCDEQEEIYNDDHSMRYRFTGWHLPIDGQMYYLDGSITDTGIFNYRLLCSPTKSNTEVKLNAYYVTQYKQIVHSYGVSGNGEKTFISCYTTQAGEAAPDIYMEAPDTNIAITIPVAKMSNNLVKFDASYVEEGTFNLSSEYKNEYMKVYSAPEDGDVCQSLIANGESYTSDPDKTIECYLDAGLAFSIYVKKEEDITSTTDIKNGQDSNGFNHEFDTLYKVIENEITTQDFSSYYNTGKATYYVDEKAVSSLYLTNRAFSMWNTITVLEAYVNGTWKDMYSYFTKYDSASASFKQVTSEELPMKDATDEARDEENWISACRKYFYYDADQKPVIATEEDNPNKTEYQSRTYYTLDGIYNRAVTYKNYVSNKNFTVDIQYVTTAVLVFYNIIYESGITVVQSDLIDDLTNGGSELTVWDNDGVQYGDWLENGESITGLTDANGEVVMRVTLQKARQGYAKQVKYALNGMKEGSGIETEKNIYDSSNSSLLNPMQNGYGRWFEYDMTQYFGTRGENSTIQTTLVFGQGSSLQQSVNKTKVGNHSDTPYQFNTQNCGNGTLNNPYYVYIKETDSNSHTTDNTQLKFLDIFWKNNEYSCCDSENNPTYFKIYMGGSLINLQGQDLSAGAAVAYPRGNTAIWSPLFADTTGDEEELRGFDGVLLGNGAVFEGLAANVVYDAQYYGVFAKVCGGVVQDVTIRNIYIDYAGNTSVDYIGGLIAYASDATLSNIQVELYTTLAYTNHSICGTSTSGAAVYIANGSAGFVGSVLGYGQNITANNVYINFRGGNYVVDLTTDGGYAGGLFGAVEGGTITNAYIQNGGSGWIVLDGGNDSSQAVGGLFGYLGGQYVGTGTPTLTNALSVDTAYMKSRGLSLILGNETTYFTGGMVGVIGYGCTMQNVTVYHSNNDNFYINEEIVSNEPKTVARAGTVLRAKLNSITDTSDTQMASTMSYGFAGGIAGVNYGTLSGSSSGLSSDNYTQTGLVHIYAGTAGGVVGANFGTVQNISLYSAGTNAFRALVWQPTSTAQSLNYGGVVGYNFEGEAKVYNVRNGEMVSSKLNVRGLVTDCYVKGDVNKSATTNSLGTAAISSSVLYVFEREDINDENYKSGSGFYTETSWTKLASSENTPLKNTLKVTNNRNYLRLGGVVGYSSGRIYNCCINKSKLSTYCNRYSYKDSPSNGTLGGYSWLIQMGLICGYFCPSDKDGNYGAETIFQTFGTGTMAVDSLEGYNTARIQSCYAKDSYLVVNGSIWMDDMWQCNNTNPGSTGVYYDYSIPIGVSCGGIVGGTGMNAGFDYAVSNCSSIGNVFSAVFQAYGSDYATTSEKTVDSGWYVENKMTSKGGKVGWGLVTSDKYDHFGYFYCKRVYCMMELNFAAISSGFTAERTGVTKDANMSFQCYYNDNTQICTAQPDFSSIQSMIYTTKSKTDTKDSTQDYYKNIYLGSSYSKRFMTYSGTIPSSSSSGALTGLLQSTASMYSTPLESLSGTPQNTFLSNITGRINLITYGFYCESADSVKVIRTDPDTGLICAYCQPTTNGFYLADGVWKKTEKMNYGSGYASGRTVFID